MCNKEVNISFKKPKCFPNNNYDQYEENKEVFIEERKEENKLYIKKQSNESEKAFIDYLE